MWVLKLSLLLQKQALAAARIEVGVAPILGGIHAEYVCCRVRHLSSGNLSAKTHLGAKNRDRLNASMGPAKFDTGLVGDAELRGSAWRRRGQARGRDAPPP